MHDAKLFWTSTGNFLKSPITLKRILFFINVSSSIDSSNRFIRAAISSCGRFQFSVEKVYSVRYLIPKRAASSVIFCTVSAPALTVSTFFHTSLFCPSSVPIHNDGHVLWYPSFVYLFYIGHLFILNVYVFLLTGIFRIQIKP